MLDFFSGSATTAHAVMQLNAEDGGNRKFIMVQLPEETDEKSEAYAQKFEEQFYQTKGLRNVEEGQTVPMPSFSSATELKRNETSETEELVTKLLNNPEALSLLKAIANKL